MTEISVAHDERYTFLSEVHKEAILNNKFRDFFQTRRGLTVGNSFSKRIFPRLVPSIDRINAVNAKCYELGVDVLQRALLKEIYAYEKFIFLDGLALFQSLLSRQWNGNKGSLCIDGHHNILILEFPDREVVLLSVKRCVKQRLTGSIPEWHIDIIAHDNAGTLLKGSRIFFRKIKQSA